MKTKITELLGIEYPIVQGAMAWIAEHHLAAAVSKAGGLGIIAGGAAPVPDALGSCVMSTSCWPSGIGPEGFAGQEPAGERGVVCPKGIVPGAPTLTPPTNVSCVAPWN